MHNYTPPLPKRAPTTTPTRTPPMTTCPHCHYSPCHRHDKTRAGTQRWMCPQCLKAHSESGLKGRPSIGDRPMTDAERMRRSRKKKRSTGLP